MTTTENYYIKQNDYKHRLAGLLGTVTVHAIILALMLYFTLMPPDPPLESQGNGTPISFGDELLGGQDKYPSPDPVTHEQFVPIEEKTDETKTITADDPESVSVDEKKHTDKKQVVKPNQPIVEKKIPPLELPQKQVDTRALYTGKKTSSNGSGNGNITGNGGDPNGDQNGDPNGNGGSGGDGSGGNGGNGGGDGNGPIGDDKLKISLSGRKVKDLPNIEDNSRSVGKVVVAITVNREGKVISAVPGQVGSTTTDANLMEKSRQAALRTTFNNKDDADEQQRGTMTFEFKFKR